MPVSTHGAGSGTSAEHADAFEAYRIVWEENTFRDLTGVAAKLYSCSGCEFLHNDVDMPFPKPGQEPYDLEQLGALLRRHPGARIIWAHCGVGRIVRPIADHAALLEKALADPALAHVSIDISWNETAKYIVATPESIQRAADSSGPGVSS